MKNLETPGKTERVGRYVRMVLLHTGNFTAFIAPEGYLERYFYLKLKMCMLWARGLSMPLAILHIYFKQLLEEQE